MRKLLCLLSVMMWHNFIYAQDIGKVYYVTFDTMFAIPYPEEVFELRAICFSFIEKNDFENMLEQTNEIYERDINYGKVKFKNKSYFIDIEGRVSDSQNIYKLKDKDAYEKILEDNKLYCKA